MSFQIEVTDWANETFPQSDAKAKVLHLFEELEEVFEEAESDKAKEELADCGLITLHLASSLGVEITVFNPHFKKEMRRKFEICKKRKWLAPDENLVVRHA